MCTYNSVSAFILTPPPPQIEHTNATTSRQRSVSVIVEAAAVRQQRLGAAEQGMGLAMPGRGVQAPTLGFELDPFQVQALDELGQNTVSRTPNDAGNATAPGCITPHESGGRITPREAGGGSAFTPVPGMMGINPPPHLPGHEFLLPGVTAGVNIGIRSTNATTSRQQSLIAAGGVGDRVVFPVGTRTRNPDQVDVLHCWNSRRRVHTKSTLTESSTSTERESRC